MRNIELLMTSLEYIERHLCNDLKTEDIAAICFCSKSTLEKLFRNMCHISVRDYIVRRRMMLAAKRLSSHPEVSILDIAVEYGYSTHESFARAFERVWNCKPSEFRKTKYTELFPRLLSAPEEGNDNMIQRRHVDISELYDLFQERKECFFIVCDIRHMTSINEISHKAGDLAILEQMRRLTFACAEEDIVFRIGGDEFCILTACKEEKYARQIADKFLALNGQTFSYEDQEIPLSLYAAVVSLKDCCHYDELFSGLHDAIRKAASQK